MFFGFLAVFIGIALIIIGTILSAFKSQEQGETRVEGGGVVFIGPIPIVFGTSKDIAWYMIIGGIILTALLIILTLMLGKKII